MLQYFVYNENGDVIIAGFSPEGYVELDRTHLLNPTSHSGYGLSRVGSRSRVRHGDREEMFRPYGVSGELWQARLRQSRRFAQGNFALYNARLVVWAHPAFANRHIGLRNDEEIIRVSMDQNDY